MVLLFLHGLHDTITCWEITVKNDLMLFNQLKLNEIWGRTQFTLDSTQQKLLMIKCVKPDLV